MAVATLTRELERLRQTLKGLSPCPAPRLARLEENPGRVLLDAGLTPDAWQADLLRQRQQQVLLLASRQAGKSTVVAGAALYEALTQPGALILLLSASGRQSGELFIKVKDLWSALGRPVAARTPRDNALRLELANGSRIISLPGEEATIRGYSGVALLVIDEAARVDDGLFYSVRPMLATSRGRLIALTTPFGRRGWFYEEWSSSRAWHRVKVLAQECPRITPDYLDEERIMLGPRWYAQEYECEFMETVGAVFSGADIDALIVEPVAARPFPE
jgi:hypothetical protein